MDGIVSVTSTGIQSEGDEINPGRVGTTRIGRRWLSATFSSRWATLDALGDPEHDS
jgi:hypothetical protein